MFVVSKKRDSIINIDKMECIYVGDDMAVKAISDNTAKMYRVGLYPTRDAAEIALDMLMNALGSKSVFQMPDDAAIDREIRRRYEERPDKFAGNGKKPVRRGGS